MGRGLSVRSPLNMVKMTQLDPKDWTPVSNDTCSSARNIGSEARQDRVEFIVFQARLTIKMPSEGFVNRRLDRKLQKLLREVASSCYNLGEGGRVNQSKRDHSEGMRLRQVN